MLARTQEQPPPPPTCTMASLQVVESTVESSVPLSCKTEQLEIDQAAPSVYYLQTTFLEEVLQAGGTHDSTIYDIENLQGPPGLIRTKGSARICPVDGRIGAAYVHCLDGQDHVGVANFMLSYTWR